MTKTKLERLTEKEYPESIKDYCYNEGTPTTWHRQRQTYKEHVIEGIYSCENCSQQRNYLLTPKGLRGAKE